MKLFNLKSFLLLLIILLLPTKLPAYDLCDQMQIHGFLSQGYIHSSDNNFLADSQNGTFEFNEIGINFNSRFHDKFRIGAQLLSRDLGDYGDNEVRLDWGLIDYHHQDEAGLRLGKIKIPMGFYNTERDSDFLRPMVFLPQSIYDETRRDLWLSQVGGELYGNLATERYGFFDYQIFYGRINYEKDTVYYDSSLANIKKRLADNQAKPTPDPNLPTDIDSFDRDNEYIYGAALVYNTPVENLRLGVTFAASRDEITSGGAQIGELKIKSKMVYSLEYSWNSLIFRSEYSENDRTQTVYGTSPLDGPSQAWYVMLTYSPTDQLSFTILYDEFYRLKHDKRGDNASPKGTIDSIPWRKDWGLGMRYDFNNNWTLKAEYHAVDGGALLLGFFNPEGPDRYWHYGTAKISFNF